MCLLIYLLNFCRNLHHAWNVPGHTARKISLLYEYTDVYIKDTMTV